MIETMSSDKEELSGKLENETSELRRKLDQVGNSSTILSLVRLNCTEGVRGSARPAAGGQEATRAQIRGGGGRETKGGKTNQVI